MEKYSLTIGAHLLLWVFPLTLLVLVIAEDLLDRLKSEPER
jgi:cytochrome c-type biogenesis protein CcmH/NrfF